ncbi:MAG: amidohydrolase [Rhizobiaceae bacterium]|nr:amidohydrolase [Rhizobiaceae bacterium]
MTIRGSSRAPEPRFDPPEGRLIDVHFHAMPPRYRDAVLQALGTSVRTPEWSPDLSLSMMDRHGIGCAVLSLSAPGVHFGDDAQANDLARACNDDLAAAAASSPRIGAFAVLPLPDVERACSEAIRALDDLRLDGVGILTGYRGRYLGHPDYDPLLDVLDVRHAVVMVHPAAHPSIKQIALGVPNFMLEYPFDTTRAGVSMLFADVLERFPNIRFILSHGGGTLPYLAWRIGAIAERQLSRPPPHDRALKDQFPTALTSRNENLTADHLKGLMRRFYFDVALTADPAGLGALVHFADPERLLFGSDWPYAYDGFVTDQLGSMSDIDLVPADAWPRIAQRNALALFPRFSSILASLGTEGGGHVA